MEDGDAPNDVKRVHIRIGQAHRVPSLTDANATTETEILIC